MIETMRLLLGEGLKIGSGFAWPISPLTGLVVTEFYDGATQGFARAKDADGFVYFRKVWWDNGQDNRVFECVGTSFSELRRSAPELYEFYQSQSRVVNQFAFSDADAKLAVELRQYVTGSIKKVSFVILCRSITEEIFLLPEMHD